MQFGLVENKNRETVPDIKKYVGQVGAKQEIVRALIVHYSLFIVHYSLSVAHFFSLSTASLASVNVLSRPYAF